MILNETYTLSNGVKMPKIGFGTYRITDKTECFNSIKWATEAKIKLIDTAWAYKNHKFIGKTLKELNINRKDIFITSKIWDDKKDLTKEDVKNQIEEILQDLQTDYLDLLLIHWPFSKSLVMWNILEEAYKNKKVRAIGVSNFTANQLKDFISKVKIKPMVNQIQYHPHLQRNEIVDFCKKNKIIVTSWQTIDEGKILTDPVIVQLAKKYNATPAQICLKWALQNGIAIIPKSVKKERILENINLDHFNISKEDMKKLNSYSSNEQECKKNKLDSVKDKIKYNEVTW